MIRMGVMQPSVITQAIALKVVGEVIGAAMLYPSASAAAAAAGNS